jgi:hypothetical protein
VHCCEPTGRQHASIRVDAHRFDVLHVFVVQGSPSSHWASLVQQFAIGVPTQEPPWQEVELVQTSPSSQNPPSLTGSHVPAALHLLQAGTEPHDAPVVATQTPSVVQVWHDGQEPASQHERPVRHTPPQQTSPSTQESQSTPPLPQAVALVPFWHCPDPLQHPAHVSAHVCPGCGGGGDICTAWQAPLRQVIGCPSWAQQLRSSRHDFPSFLQRQRPTSLFFFWRQ